ncbi:MAG TPA: c-type cytochrome, partial [Anaerolineales bacterium]|nr:c-type cytochrome [Anaerolineales bacterium]
KSDKNRKTSPLLLLMFCLYLLAGGSSAHELQTAEVPSAEMIANGDVENGRKLFMGYVHLEHEGPPCMGCHNVGENGLLGGGALGPDLTNITTEWSDDEIIGLMSNTGPLISPVMQPIYAVDPLTAQEQADLLAFMKVSVGEPEADRELLVLGVSILLTIGAVIVLGFVYRNRLRSVRRALVTKAEKELL